MTVQRWVLIESGSTQEFIFQSNRQRFHVGASALVTDLPSWVDEAVRTVPGIRTVSAISASAVLLSDSPEAGREVVRAVSERALVEAPGLDVWGYVEPDDAAAQGDAMERLTDARHALNRTRTSRPAAKARFPMTPFFDQCRVTGLPAVGTLDLLGDKGQPASALTEAVWRRAQRAHAQWRSALETAVPSDIDHDLGLDGWVAVIHADGNGIGAVIDDLESPEELTAFSTALESATQAAFVEAVREVGAEDWILPVLVGGDDVTLICRASHATAFVRAYLLAFEAVTTNAAEIGTPLTASAGVAFVKPHYPFSEAYALAQQLTRSAKKGRTDLRAHGLSAWDFHVLHDSLARPLDEIRQGHRQAIVAPLLVSTDGQKLTGEQARHEDQPIMNAAAQLMSPEPPLSNKTQHTFRAALLLQAGRRAAIDQIRQRATDVGGAATAEFLEKNFDDDMKGLLTVMDLVDVTTGTSRAVN